MLAAKYSLKGTLGGTVHQQGSRNFEVKPPYAVLFEATKPAPKTTHAWETL